MTAPNKASSSKLLTDSGSRDSSSNSLPPAPSPSSSQMVDSQGSFFINEDNIYEVEAILDKRIKNKEVQYYIKWKDWDLPEHNTWEGMANLKTVKHLIDEFEIEYKKRKSNQSKPISKKDKKQSKSETQIHSQHRLKNNIQQGRDADRKKQYESVKQFDKNRQIQSQSKSIIMSDDDYEIMPASTQLSGPQTCMMKKQSVPKNVIDLSEEQITTIARKQSSIRPKEKQKQFEKTKQKQKEKQKDNQKAELHFGGLAKYYVENGQIYYQIDMMDSKKRVIGVRRLKSEEMRNHSQESLRIFLEQQLIDIDRYEQMELSMMQRGQFVKNQD